MLSDDDTRQGFIRETLDIVPSEPLARELSELKPFDLVRTLIEGKEESRDRSRARSTSAATRCRRCRICSSRATSRWASTIT